MKNWLLTLTTLALLIAAIPVYGLEIVFSDSAAQDGVESRLIGLGHTVSRVPMSTFTGSFDYSQYDVLILNYGDGDVPDIPYLVGAVDAGQIGVVFMQAPQSSATALALGLIGAGGSFAFQPATLTIHDNSHPATWGLATATPTPLGHRWMTLVTGPLGANTTILGSGVDGPALVVHNSRRVASLPYYGHPSDHDSENATGLTITEQTLQWLAITGVSNDETGWGKLKANWTTD